MKNYQTICTSIFLLLAMLLCWACVHDTKKTDPESTSATTPPLEEETTFEHNPIWEYDYEADNLVRVDSTSSDLTVEDAIQTVNTMYKDKVQLDFIRQNGDTLFVRIDTATVLTQQMGSAGARAYMSVALFTLTEPKEVQMVHFDFEEGDHAIPGLYKRDSFKKK